MAERQKMKANGITRDSIRQMLAGTAEQGPHIVTLSPREAKLLMTQVEIVNGRGVDKSSGQVVFAFSEDGRFDSFTPACAGLDQAEALYSTPLRVETDHLFLYTKLFPQEPSVHDGYALFIKMKRLFYFAAHQTDSRLMKGETFAVDPDGLLNYMNRCNGSLKDDTVFEQMCWVRAAQKHGLLASEYPEFIGGVTEIGQGDWLVLPTSAPTPQGFILRLG